MEKRWNPEIRAWEYYATGLFIDGIDYTVQTAMTKWHEREGKEKCRDALARALISQMIEDGLQYDKHHLWLNAMEVRIAAAAAARVAEVTGKVTGGQTGKILWSSIPAQYKPGLQAIITHNGHNPTYDRGAHNTCPAKQTGGFSNYREFHLTNARDGRAVTAQKGGEVFLYYSTTHAASTYNYQLVVYPFRLASNGETYEVPLSGGTRDKLIKYPWQA